MTQRTDTLLRPARAALAGACALLLLSGCASQAVESGEVPMSAPESTAEAQSAEETPGYAAVTAGGWPTTIKEALEANHGYWTADPATQDSQNVVELSLDGENAASTPVGVTRDSGTVTVSEAGTYRVSGALDGQLVVSAADDDQVTLIFAGVQISNADGPAVILESADGVYIELEAGTANALSDADSYPEDADADAALFSRVDLQIGGGGTLQVNGNGADGIASKDDLVITGGKINVSAADDGLRGKDALVITDGTVTIEAIADGAKTTNLEEAGRGYFLITGGIVDISAGDDGIDSATDALFAAGQVRVLESSEGIEAQNILMEGGSIEVTAADDGLNATAGSTGTVGGFQDDGSNLIISGGAVTVNAEGDGIDSNGSLVLSGGKITVFGTQSGGNGAFDANGSFTLSGGEVLALSAGQMEQGPNVVEQTFFQASISGQPGPVELLNSDNLLQEITAPKPFGYVFYSAPDLADGDEVTIRSGDISVVATGASQPSEQFGGGRGPGMSGMEPGGDPSQGQPGGPPAGTPPGRMTDPAETTENVS